MVKLVTFILMLVVTPVVWGAEITTWYEQNQNEPLKVYARATLDGRPAEIWRVLVNVNRHKEYMPLVYESVYIGEKGIQALTEARTNNANLLRRVARKHQINTARISGRSWEEKVFMTLDLPFPVANRWYVLTLKQDESKASRGIYQQCWSLVMGNIDEAIGCWKIKPSEIPGKTFVYYENINDAGGKVPKWMSRLGATQTTPKILKSLEKFVQHVAEEEPQKTAQIN
jgi:hypothetical protein